MSSSTWTPAALSSDARALAGTCWRLVEAQHHVSTLKLVDSVDEQKLLEDLIEATKPPLPPECRDLHYLLSTPFRYGAVYPTGSRFRRAGMTEGVFYASETPQTAVAEMAFYRLLFFAESPNTPWPSNPAEYTAFSAQYATKKAIDLTKGKYSADRALWMHVTDYTPLPGVRRCCARGQDRGHSLRVDSRSRPGNKSRAAHLPRFREIPNRPISRHGIFASAKPGPKRSARHQNPVSRSTAKVLLLIPASPSCAGFELRNWL